MMALCDILPVVTCNAAMPKEPNPGLTTMAGHTNQLIQARNTPLTESQLTAIAAQNTILSAVSQGDITPAEANSLSPIIDQLIRAYETQIIETKLNELEARLDREKRNG